MIPAMAISGSMKRDRPEIMINGMAKPMEPFTNPATNVTPMATAKAQGGIKAKLSCNMSVPFADVLS
jgi:hypothetical protein